ncbi:MAG: hypothetical protein VKK04_06550 [Synechococcales bacterium]|nr:hypothetical protein [Synechococcales bacterium]
MAERPIKKSERMAAAQSSDGESTSQEKPVSQEKQDREFSPPAKGKGQKKGGKGRDKQRDEKPSTPMNPALMRGPKPVPPKPPKEEEPEAPEATEAADESTGDEAPPEES